MTWQPIETAPKDGSEFLAGSHGKPSGRFYYNLVHWNGAEGEFDTRSRLGAWPTHWMPLPEPPEQQP